MGFKQSSSTFNKNNIDNKFNNKITKSIYIRHLLGFGSQSERSHILNSNKRKNPNKNFNSRTMTINYKINGTDIDAQTKIEYLDYIDDNIDILEWVDNFKRAMSVTGYDEETSNKILRALVNIQIDLNSNKTGIKKNFAKLIQIQYTSERQTFYMAKLKRTRQENFTTIQEYYDEIKDLSRKDM